MLTKLGIYLDLKRIWNPIDFQGQRSRSQGLIFRQGDMPRFALPFFLFLSSIVLKVTALRVGFTSPPPPQFYEGIHVIKFLFSVYCFVDHCFYFVLYLLAIVLYWNIVETGIKHHNTNPCIVCLSSIYGFWLSLSVNLIPVLNFPSYVKFVLFQGSPHFPGFPPVSRFPSCTFSFNVV